MAWKFSFLKPDFKKVAPEFWQDIFKSSILAGLGALGVILAKQLPVVGTVLNAHYDLPLYGLILFVFAGLLIGFWVASVFLHIKLRDLNHLADTDPLTRLGNLRRQKLSLSDAMRGASSEGQPLSIIYLDIDYFKRVNDTAGHDSGDYVLKQFAALLDQNRKVSDIVCRSGGDEFLVIAPKTAAPGALNYANKLRNEIANTPFKALNQKPDVTITASAGVAEFNPVADKDPETFVQRAEAAMRKAKDKRNHVELA